MNRTQLPVKLLMTMALTNLSYDRKLTAEMSLNAHILDAMRAISLLSDHVRKDQQQCAEINYCIAALGWNLSYSKSTCLQLAQKTMSDAQPVAALLAILKRNFHAQAALPTLQLTVGAMVNYSRHAEYWESLSEIILGDAVALLLATHTHLHVKLVSSSDVSTC
jgi:hypothetical protein